MVPASPPSMINGVLEELEGATTLWYRNAWISGVDVMCTPHPEWGLEELFDERDVHHWGFVGARVVRQGSFSDLTAENAFPAGEFLLVRLPKAQTSRYVVIAVFQKKERREDFGYIGFEHHEDLCPEAPWR